MDHFLKNQGLPHLSQDELDNLHQRVCVCVLSHFSRVCLSVTPRTAALQAPLSMGFSREGYWGGLPFPPPGDLPDPEIELTSPVLAGGFFTTEPAGARALHRPTNVENLRSRLQCFPHRMLPGLCVVSGEL